MSLATATATQKMGIYIPRADIPLDDNRTEEIIDKIEYLLRKKDGPVGVQRDVDVVIPEIESLLKELKKAIRKERKPKKEPKTKAKH